MTLFFGSLWILVNGLADTLPLLSAACLHEAGHLLMCLMLRVPVRFFSPSPLGAVIGCDPTRLSYGAEAAVALAGPAAGLMGTAFAALLPPCRFTALFAISSLSLSIFNLLPAAPLDGFVFLRAVLSGLLEPGRAGRILEGVSTLAAVLLWMGAAAVQLRCGGNLSLFLLSVYMLLSLAIPLGTSAAFFSAVNKNSVGFAKKLLHLPALYDTITLNRFQPTTARYLRKERGMKWKKTNWLSSRTS